eukprot:3854561-Rhodomonas_salina.2
MQGSDTHCKRCLGNQKALPLKGKAPIYKTRVRTTTRNTTVLIQPVIDTELSRELLHRPYQTSGYREGRSNMIVTPGPDRTD